MSLLLVVALLLSVVTLTRRWFLAGGPYYPTAYSMLYNGQNGDGKVTIGLATSTDVGLTWTRHGAAVIPRGAGGSWDDDQVHGPDLTWDGSQWVCYADGYDGTNYRVGRWTSPDLITWTPYASNPVIGLGAGFDAAGIIGPRVLYEPTLSPPWKMWYTGVDISGGVTVGYADSTDGLAWTRRGQVLSLGTAGAFDDVYVGTGTALRIGSTYYIFYGGSSDVGAFPHTRPGLATATDPANVATYTKLGVLSGLSGNVTSLDDGLTYTANNITRVIVRNGAYIGYGTAFQPTPDIGQHEVAYRTTSTDLLTWTTPTGVLLPLSGGSFDTISAENPSVVPTY